MKVTIVFLTVVTLAFAKAIEEKNEGMLSLEQNLLKQLILNYVEGLSLNDEAGITAVINELADKVAANIRIYAVTHNLDPAPLDPLEENIMLAHIGINNGLLHGISSLTRYGDVVVNYKSHIRTLQVQIPISFDKISFTYDYVASIMGMGPRGSLQGKIDEFKLFLVYSFNFNTLSATIDTLKTTNSGHVSFTLDGNLSDIIFNAMSQFVTTFLHPFLQIVIEGIVKDEANKVVVKVNDFLYRLTHPDDTTVNQFIQYPLIN